MAHVEIRCNDCVTVSLPFDATNEAGISEWLSKHIIEKHPVCAAEVTIGTATFRCPIDGEHSTHGGYMHAVDGTVYWKGSRWDIGPRPIHLPTLEQRNGPMINKHHESHGSALRSDDDSDIG